MQKLPIGTLLELENTTGLSKQKISDYLCGRVSMTKKRSIILEEQTLPFGPFFTKENWMFYPKKIKQSLVDYPLSQVKNGSKAAI